MKSITVAGFFSGIGGIEQGFSEAGFKTVFANDFDKNCKITFDQNTKDVPLTLGGIEDIDPETLPEFHVLTGGFPCQPFSIAGYKRGFEDKGRGKLFFDLVDIIEAKQPKAFLLENVKGLMSHDKGGTIKTIASILARSGYFVAIKVLNTSTHANIPQNRARIFIIGFKSKESFSKFSFPAAIPLTKTVKKLLHKGKVADKYYYEGKPLHDKLINEVVKKETFYQWRRKYVRENKTGVCPTLTANMGTGGHNVPLIVDDYGIRKITPRECARLQGFKDSFELPEIADGQLYKQLGNSVTVPLIKRIADNIMKSLLLS